MASLVLVLGSVEVAPAAVAGADPALGTVSGRVTSGGVGVPGVCVRFDAVPGSEVLTGPDGRYTMAVQAVPGRIGVCRPPEAYTFTAPYPLVWYPSAASRTTAAVLQPRAGEVVVADVDLPPGQQLSAVVSSLADPTGCSVVYRPFGSTVTTRAPLRATGVAGTYFSDLVGFARPDREPPVLECGGRVPVVGIEARSDTPLAQGELGSSFMPPPLYDIRADVTGPDILSSFSSPLGVWTNRPVRVDFACSDGSGVAACPGPVVLGMGQVSTVEATDRFGNRSTRSVGPLPVDTIPPTPFIPGAGVTYRRDDPILLRCEMRDEGGSGIAWARSNCPAFGTPGRALGVGRYVYFVEGADRAGNLSTFQVAIEIVK